MEKVILLHGRPLDEVDLEEEERHAREMVAEQEQQQLLMVQLDQKIQKPEEDASSAPLLAGLLQTVAEVQIQEKFRVAVVTTDRFRAQQRENWNRFLDTQLRWIINKRQGEAPQYRPPGEVSSAPSSSSASTGNDVDSDFSLEFEVMVTGGTYLEMMEHYRESVAQRQMSSQEFDAIRRRVHRLPEKTHGIVQVAFELVEGRLGAVFHLCDYKDINGSHASGVLRRQSMVHNVPYADSLHGAEAICISWWRSFQVDSRPLAIRSSTPFPTSFSSKPSGGASKQKKKEKLPSTRAGNVLKLKDLERHSKSSSNRMVMDGIVSCTDYNNNIALIAHDGKKLELCCLALENIQKLLRFDHILCTGTTGGWLKRFFTATLDSISNASGNLPFPVNLEEKLIICESGPKGGDVQIAFACLSGYCSRVIFLIDPMEAHPHEVDIRFFEQAVESSPKYPVHVATNVESALYLLSSLRDE